MVKYGIEPTFSNDESVNPPPPPPSYPYTDDNQEPFPDEQPKDVDDLELDANDEAYEHTLSEHEFRAGPYEKYDSADDATDIEGETEADMKEKRRPLSKNRNLLGLLALFLMLIVVALGVANRSRNNNPKGEGDGLAVSEANSAITESSAAIVDPTEIKVTEPPKSVPTEDPKPPSPVSIFDLVCSTEGLETLCALTAEACTTDGLETICDTVTGPGPFTVFAPSNSAFQELSMPLKDAIQNPEFLSDIIMSHVVEGKILSTDLVCDAAVTMANMEVTTTLCNDGDFYQSAPGNIDVLPKIVTTDVNASNGVVHVIDQVILPGDMNSNTPGQFPGGNYPKDCMDEVFVAKKCYTFGEPIEITYKSCSPNANNWLGVFRQGQSGQMRQRAAYWELPCGGHGDSCATPMGSGTITMNPRVGAGRYQVHGIGNMDRPYVSNSSSHAFVVQKRCRGPVKMSKGRSPSYH